MKRIVNCFNVSRHIAELRCGNSNDVLSSLSPKILKMVILIEQWPYRMAWIFQLIEDVEQMCSHNVHDSRMFGFLEKEFKRTYRKASDKKAHWNILRTIRVQDLYQAIRRLLKFIDATFIHAIDSDPQLFEGLLNLNDRPYTITVEDMRSIGQNVRNKEYDSCLRSYVFNMPMAISDKVSKKLNEALQNYSDQPNATNVGPFDTNPITNYFTPSE